VLRDEAELEGLYPRQDQPPEERTVQFSPLSRRERAVGLLVAQAQRDKRQVGLLEHATPHYKYVLPDTFVPQQMLHILTLMYVNEQLEQAAMCINAMFCQAIDPDPEQDDERDAIAKAAAYLYRIGHDAWHQFMGSLGIDPALLLEANYLGGMLAFCDKKVCEIAPRPRRCSWSWRGLAIRTRSCRQPPVWRRAGAGYSLKSARNRPDRPRPPYPY
jgi:hypothetical protein